MLGKQADSYLKYFFSSSLRSALPVPQPREVKGRSPEHSCFVPAAAAHTPRVLLLFMGLLGPCHMASDGNFGLSAVSGSPSHPAELLVMEKCWLGTANASSTTDP